MFRRVCLSALSWCGLALLKSSLFDEMSEFRRPMDASRCFIIVGGWLELVSMKLYRIFILREQQKNRNRDLINHTSNLYKRKYVFY